MYGIKFKHVYAIGARINIEVLSPEACVQLKTQTNRLLYYDRGSRSAGSVRSTNVPTRPSVSKN